VIESSLNRSDVYAAAYAELRRLARRERRRVGQPATLNTTALVHETWFKLRADIEGAGLAQNEFLAIAARAMRQVLVDHARKLNAEKRRHVTVTLSGSEAAEHAPDSGPMPIIELDSALCRLADVDVQLARIVDLHVFSGLEFSEIAHVEGISERSVFRLWRNARVFLLHELAA
jgi:RNA polymerase sigma factor (TIGR02999 family)